VSVVRSPWIAPPASIDVGGNESGVAVSTGRNVMKGARSLVVGTVLRGLAPRSPTGRRADADDFVATRARL